MGWQKDPRQRAGGRWECREKRREYNKTRHEQRVAWVNNRYHTDTVYRITQDLRDRRRKALKRKAARHLPREDDRS